MTKQEAYTESSRQFMNKAFNELAQGDVVQASEKGWGAAAQMVKAIAEQRGWTQNSHLSLRQVARRLAGETGDRQLFRLFRVASDLHTNFYENWDSPEDVQEGLHDVQLLLDKLEPLLE